MNNDINFNSHLVSVCVVTYNSSLTIINTLNSILNQKYDTKRIELIISDDSSQDDTISIVNSWLKKYHKFFNKVIVIESSKNQGVPKNVNKALKSASSKWVKPIAGDDILTHNALYDYINYSLTSDSMSFICAKMECINENSLKIHKFLPKEKNLLFYSLTQKEQLEYLAKHSFNMAPTFFIKKELLEKIDYCDESFTLIEDLPLLFRTLLSGEKIYFLDTVTVNYRVNESISNSKKRFINETLSKQIKEINRKYILDNKNIKVWWLKIDKKLEWLALNLIIKLGNKNNAASKIIYSAFCIIRPSWYSYKFKRSIK